MVFMLTSARSLTVPTLQGGHLHPRLPRLTTNPFSWHSRVMETWWCLFRPSLPKTCLYDPPLLSNLTMATDTSLRMLFSKFSWEEKSVYFQNHQHLLGVSFTSSPLKFTSGMGERWQNPCLRNVPQPESSSLVSYSCNGPESVSFRCLNCIVLFSWRESHEIKIGSRFNLEHKNTLITISKYYSMSCNYFSTQCLCSVTEIGSRDFWFLCFAFFCCIFLVFFSSLSHSIFLSSWRELFAIWIVHYNIPVCERYYLFTTSALHNKMSLLEIPYLFYAPSQW